MQVEFATNKLAKQCANDKNRLRAFGAGRAKKLKIRLTLLVNAETLEELRNAPGRFHELRGDRAGLLAADLDGPYRLIIEPVIPPEEAERHANGLVWSAVKHVRIVGIEDYHG